MADTGWFADTDEDGPDGFKWQAFLQDASGCYPLPIWFQNEAECEQYIRDSILGQSMLS